MDNRDLLDHCDALENVDQGTEWIPNEDIDRFIASVTVPPPPTTVALGSFTFKEHSPVQELTQEEISAFIIPPPPASSSSDTETEMISRLQSVAESVEKMVHCEGSMETYGSDKTRLRKEVKENDQRDRSLTEMQQNPEVKLFLAGEIVSSTCDSINMTQHGDSSGYETYASSAISSMDIQQTRRALNNSFSDNSSTISCSSSSTADMAGSHADTEDNALDGELPSNSPMFGTTGHLRHIRKLEGNSKHTTLQTHHSLSVTSTSNGLTSPRPLYPNGIIMPSAGVVGGRGIGYSTSHVRCSSSSSDDGPAETQGVTNSGSPRRQSSIPRHQGSSTLTPRKAPRTSQTRMNRNRSSSTDNLNGATIDDNRDNGELSIKAKNGIDSSPSLGESVSNNWSASTENLATAAATAATDRRTGATPKSPTSPVTRSPCKSAGSKPLYHVGDSVDTGTILKSPAKERSHLGNNKIPKPATSVAIMQVIM